jgi:hypothetical protein
MKLRAALWAITRQLLPCTWWGNSGPLLCTSIVRKWGKSRLSELPNNFLIKDLVNKTIPAFFKVYRGIVSPLPLANRSQEQIPWGMQLCSNWGKQYLNYQRVRKLGKEFEWGDRDCHVLRCLPTYSEGGRMSCEASFESNNPYVGNLEVGV